MNSFSRRNLKDFCRTCLSNINKKSSFVGIGVADSNDPKYDLSLMPQLRKLLVIFTSLDVCSNDEDYPQRLCHLCYDKLQDFQEFRRMILESAEKIELILQTSETSTAKAFNNTSIKQNKQKDIINECSSDDDDKLLLPELAADWNPAIVKAEPVDLPEPVEEISIKKSIDIQVKNEIDSEYEQDDSNCEFYERNALNQTHNFYGSDGHNDEQSFSKELFFSASFQAFKSGVAKTAKPRKRDRNKKALKCPRCDKQVYKKVYLDAHIRAIHEGHEKPFLCSECQKSFTRYNQLHVHMQTNHTVAIKFVCGIAGCSATFKMNQTLETHRKVVHTAEQTAAPVELNEIIAMHQEQLVQEWELDHFCKECGKKYSSKRALSEHLKRHSSIKEHVCNVCGVAKVTRTELVTHMRTHESNLEKFKCTLCPQEFNHKNAISRHIRVVHEGERRFICSYCPRRFGTRHAQVSHERLHTGERPFKCNFCAKGFAQVEGLKSHMKNHDKSLRKHVCKFCSQRFITRKNLVDHEQRHLGNKPHICMVCSRGFFNREDLDLHTKIHEEEEESSNEVVTRGSTKRRIEQLEESNNDVSTEGESVLGIEPNGENSNETESDEATL